MKIDPPRRLGAATGWLLLSFVAAIAQVQPSAAQPVDPKLPVPNSGQAPQVLEQGPLHEAFAKPLALEAQAVVMDRPPPAAVNELPPLQRPAGANINWLPGYWSFDSEHDRFVWVSGLWRLFPPGRSWVPGEWQQVPSGYQWVTGYWADTQIEQQTLLPAPPATLEQGPSSPAPGDHHLWTPGCWQRVGDGYAWQTGYWYVAQPDWVWMPTHYCYTPRGAVYVSGYWDYPIVSRGLVYAPVTWSAGHHVAETPIFRPRTIIDTGRLVTHLLVDRRHGRYFYCNNRGRRQDLPSGLVAWNQHSTSGRGHSHGHAKLHDPLWAHFRWDRHRHGADGRRIVESGRGATALSRTDSLPSQRLDEPTRRQIVNNQQRRFDRDRPFTSQRREHNSNLGSDTRAVSPAWRRSPSKTTQPLATRTTQPTATRTAQPRATRTARPMTRPTAQPLSTRGKLRPDARPSFSQRAAKPLASIRSGNRFGNARTSQTNRPQRGQAVQRQQQAQSQFRRSGSSHSKQKMDRGGGKRPNR